MMNQQMIMALLNSNPLFTRAQQMAEGKSTAELQQIAMNLCKERGLDFQDMLQQFQSVVKNLNQ